MKQLFSLLIATLLLSCHKDNSNKIEPFTVKDNNKMVIRFEGSNVMTDSIGVLSKLEVVRKVAHSSSQNTQDTIYVSVTKYVHF